eukprot:TRINITY_DN2851_c0_g1_i1.p1 TRINITY_DN2851_c0_g1~~TRINITY_DN2851_c0_g1_i1.p1  ORF type:complete len:78 (+),score=2.95 TRINITY_DN2851_c0_g1_i1:153-386(+)
MFFKASRASSRERNFTSASPVGRSARFFNIKMPFGHILEPVRNFYKGNSNKSVIQLVIVLRFKGEIILLKVTFPGNF